MNAHIAHTGYNRDISRSEQDGGSAARMLQTTFD